MVEGQFKPLAGTTTRLNFFPSFARMSVVNALDPHLNEVIIMRYYYSESELVSVNQPEHWHGLTTVNDVYIDSTILAFERTRRFFFLGEDLET